MPYTGIVGRPQGQIVPLVNTMKRTKQITLTPTGSGWTSTRSVAVFYMDSNNVWRVAFNIGGTVSPAITSAYPLTLSGVVFRSEIEQSVSVLSDGTTPYTGSGNVEKAASRIFIYPATSSTTLYISGDVELNAEPTWTSLGTTWAAVAEAPGDVAAYIPMADASTAGLLSTVAQTVGGVKNFQDGVKIGGNETIITYDEGSFTARFKYGMNTTDDASNDVTITYVRLGKLVTLFFPEKKVTANATNAQWYTATGVLNPAALAPSALTASAVHTINNNALDGYVGRLEISATGQLVFTRLAASGLANWTSTTTNCGFGSVAVTYICA